ncbi:hypothetical protein Bcav_0244 [Beutenbergia cavernae DSM 12333]|uniref:DUF4399 domain-containing protein n=1 Tax=Beutenbergia cavernae (strain ATCC BAA-8 / DSM 12333 / CCUG 43141 / JCM 11478 / NBRC 16432 / NCIMB 13614 / HKI 0122) TaxID=471853 RepID=C5BVR9_BEUC1|nr:hypothetical protein [Beutenbergia cavernae]ACQ78509.1 hypothetical protein Bcav_0244 [Beutenbergia cavernae DSM 12333]
MRTLSRLPAHRPGLLAAAAAVVVLTLAGCGGDGGDDGAEPAAGGDGPTVEIIEPADGDSLSAPFTFVVSSSEELGTTESGNHHVHLYFDGDDSAYEVIESGNGEEHEITADSPALEGLEQGEHTMNVSLRNADHSAAGAEDEITVTIETAGGDSGDTGDGY